MLARWGATWPWIPDDGREIGESDPEAISIADVLGDGFDVLSIADLSGEALGFMGTWVVSRGLACLVHNGADGPVAGPPMPVTLVLDSVRTAIGASRPQGQALRLPAAVAGAIAGTTTEDPVEALGGPSAAVDAALATLEQAGIIARDNVGIRAGSGVETIPALAALASGDLIRVARFVHTGEGLQPEGSLRLVGPTGSRWLWASEGRDDLVLPVPEITDAGDPVEHVLLELAIDETGPSSLRSEWADRVLPGEPEALVHVSAEDAGGRHSFGVVTWDTFALAWHFDGDEVSSEGLELTDAAGWLVRSILSGAEPVASAPDDADPAAIGALVQAAGAKRCVQRMVVRGAATHGSVSHRLDLTVLLTDAGSIAVDALPYPVGGERVSCYPAHPEMLVEALTGLLLPRPTPTG
jgi:hypothetical protein